MYMVFLLFRYKQKEFLYQVYFEEFQKKGVKLDYHDFGWQKETWCSEWDAIPASIHEVEYHSSYFVQMTNLSYQNPQYLKF